MAQKRKRGQNFVLEEKDRLVKLLVTHKDTILNKNTNGSTNDAKNKAWIDVTKAFNSSAKIYRTKKSLMKIWEKLKRESKLYDAPSRRNTTGTSGGPAEVKVDPIMEQVYALLGQACTGVMDVPDCDVKINQEMDDILQKKVCIENISTEDVQIQDESDLEFCISKTKRHTQLSQVNESTKALCNCFTSVNREKEDIEDLKRQLLQEEIKFKRKLYELQLQVAAKEFEIKTEMLNQIRA